MPRPGHQVARLWRLHADEILYSLVKIERTRIRVRKARKAINLMDKMRAIRLAAHFRLVFPRRIDDCPALLCRQRPRTRCILRGWRACLGAAYRYPATPHPSPTH